MNLNKTTQLIGRLVKDPYFTDKQVFFTLAVPNTFKNRDGEYATNFISVKAFVTQESQRAYYSKFVKGDKVHVAGTPKMYNFNVQLQADTTRLVESAQTVTNAETNTNEYAYVPVSDGSYQTTPDNRRVDISEDDLPF